MSFLYPTFFWALLLVAIPIIIHLFNFRIHKTVYFSNIKFLQNIKNVSESKSKLKNFIILLLRILTLVALILAFARPYIPLVEKKDTLSESIVTIYLDNSYSMNAESIHGNLFDAAKERARILALSYDNRQKFLFLTNDLKPQHRILTNKQQILEFIAKCELSVTPKKNSEIMAYRKRFLNENLTEKTRHIIYFISDFQKNIADFYTIENDSLSVNYLLPLATNKVNNIYIDSCWFSAPGRNLNKVDELNVRVVNMGDEAYQDIPINLYIKGKQKGISSFEIDANSTKTIPIKYTNTETGLLPAYLEITDYPITYDNRFYFSYQIREKTSVLLINSKAENKYINALFKSDSSFTIQNTFAGNIHSSEFSNYQLIILDELEAYSTGLIDELKRFVSKGGVLVCIPGPNSQINQLNDLLGALNAGKVATFVPQATQISGLNYEHFIYKDVFTKKQDKLSLPEIKTYFNYQANYQTTNRSLLTANNGKIMLNQNNYEKGKVYLFLFSLNNDNSNFVSHPLFVPTIYNIAAFSQSDEKLYYTIGEDKLVESNLTDLGNEETFHVVDYEQNTDFIPQLVGIGEFGLRLNFHDNIKRANNYFIVSNQDTLKSVSYNYNREESDPAFYEVNEILELINKNQLTNTNLLPASLDELKVQVNDTLKERKDLWKWFILFAICSIAAEILVIRLWKE
jgi:hypothetical protein